ncbi:MAG: nickel pincer cofactor biosynthesis protein LarC, partial [Candidatus Dormibacteraeota bacterium]|nr:nickel pincer cofactor biosynthesis protein LarC [Candidatus Dormibacteraeota bacterium]
MSPGARIAHFDCPSGISGDMALGALLDAGADRALLAAVVGALGLEREVEIDVRHEERGNLGGLRVAVRCAAGPPRNVPELESAMRRAELPPRVRWRALDALGRLARAEAAVHGLPPERLHLHELGGADTLVDLVGAFWLLESLEVDEVTASALPAPGGPHSAPGTLRVLADTTAVLTPDDRRAELVTPTGAAILATVARFERPAMSLERVGYGLGARDEPGNATALWLGRRAEEVATIEVLETNLDDMAPNLLAALVEDLLAAGALDVTVTPVLMKKGRPGHLLSVMAEPERGRDLARMVLERSSSLGVRLTAARRITAGRRVLEVETASGPVRVKVKELDGRAVDVAPEYEDCRRAGGDAGGTARVMREAAAAARARLGLQ